MTGAHWLLLAAATVAAVLWLWLTRRRPRVWRREEIDEIRDRARERSDDIRRWVDEPGDPTHEQIDQALHVVAEQCCDLHNRNCELPSELCCWDCSEAEHTDKAMRRLIGNSPISEDRKSGLLGEWHDRLEHATAEEVADCAVCSPSSLPRRIEGGDEHG